MAISKILDNLYIGDRDTQNPQVRRKLGITAILNCAAELYSSGKEGEIYEHLPLYDMNWIHPLQLMIGILFIQKHLEAGRKVLVFCNAGMSRSVGIVWAYMIHMGWDWNQAWLHIREKRPVAKPCYLIELSVKRFFNIEEW